jgi:PAS domain S-box-containing protein
VTLTDRKSGAETINDRAWLYESVLSASSDHIYIYDRSGVYLYASPSGARALGLEPEDIVGRHWRELGLPSQIMERFDAHREEVFVSGKAVAGRTGFPTLMGLRDYEYVVTPIRDHSGAVTAAACAVRDVTDEQAGVCAADDAAFRFRLDDAQDHGFEPWATEGQLRLVADSLPLLVSYVDDQQRYRFNNRAYQDWFGLAPGEIRDRSIRDVLGEAAYDQIRPYVEAALAGRLVSFAQTLPYQGTEGRYVRAQYIPDKGPRGEVRGFFALVEELSAIGDDQETPPGEAEVPQVEALAKEFSMQIGSTAAEVLHELGQPITAIASYSDAVLRMLDQHGAVTDEVLDWIDAIRLQARRAREIVRRFRAFLRGGELKRSTIELGTLLSESLRSMDPVISEHGVQVQVERDAEPCYVSVDPVLLQQAICNVVTNAAEAMSNGDARLLRICLRAGPGLVKLGIVDSGPGIPPEIGERVFDPFFTTKTEGVGVGLALSRSIVIAHGGRLDLLAGQGCGACFEITLPRGAAR